MIETKVMIIVLINQFERDEDIERVHQDLLLMKSIHVIFVANFEKIIEEYKRSQIMVGKIVLHETKVSSVISKGILKSLTKHC
jgi:hypothetical protein